jgi:hypothetical protein
LGLLLATCFGLRSQVAYHLTGCYTLGDQASRPLLRRHSRASSAQARRKARSSQEIRSCGAWGRARSSISMPLNLIVIRLNLGVANLL